VLALAYVLDLFVHEFTGSGAGALSGAQIGARFLDCASRGHGDYLQRDLYAQRSSGNVGMAGLIG
jgi:hypothetical protein